MIRIFSFFCSFFLHINNKLKSNTFCNEFFKRLIKMRKIIRIILRCILSINLIHSYIRTNNVTMCYQIVRVIYNRLFIINIIILLLCVRLEVYINSLEIYINESMLISFFVPIHAMLNIDKVIFFII